MKILLDQGLSPLAAALLRDRGFDAVHTLEIGLSTATDVQIIDYARETGRCIFTFDADFHGILALTHASAPSTVRIRVEGLRDADAANLIERIVVAWRSELESGAVISFANGKVRMRRLPFIRPPRPG